MEALQNGSGVFKEHECWDEPIKIVVDKKSKIVGKEHHFVGSRFVAIPFCRLEKRSQNHFVDKESSTLQNGPP